MYLGRGIIVHASSCFFEVKMLFGAFYCLWNDIGDDQQFALMWANLIK